MGGRGSSSGLSGGGNKSTFSVGQRIEINGYKIEGGYVTSPSGKGLYVSQYKELTDSQKRKMKQALEKAGIYDPVISGRAILPREVATAAINQRNMERDALYRNVPGLDKLRAARLHDYEQRELFRKDVERGGGGVKGNINSNTASGVAKKYPVAVAYLKAESFYQSNNHVKSSIGKEAMNKIASGRNASKVIKDMERKWSKYAKSKVYD